jgi:hypothetical protein
LLKRGCTEFEQAIGPSDKWSWDDEQVEEERIYTNAFVQDITAIKQRETQLSRVFYAWIHKAFQWGDMKYKMFTNDNNMFEPPVTYHDMEPEKLEEVRENGKKCPR